MDATITRRVASVIAMLLAAALAVTVLAPLASARDRGTDYDGRELVSGLLLGTGDVAAKLPEVFGDLPDIPERALKAEDLLLDQVEKADPRFFDLFAAEVTSGDHIRVSQALEEGARLLNDVVVDTQVARQLDFRIPFVWRWLPYLWHYRWRPFLWDEPFRHQYEWQFDYDGTMNYRQFVRWDPKIVTEFERYELDPGSELANERFVDLVVERLAH